MILINLNQLLKKIVIEVANENDVTLNNIFFNRLNELPDNSQNKLVYASDNLYFNHQDQWIKLGVNDGILSRSLYSGK